MKTFIKSQNSFDQDNITRAVSQGFSINEKHSEISWLVWFGLVWLNVAGTTVTSRVPTGDSTCTLLRITQPSSSTVASEEFGIHIRSGDLKLQQGWVVL